MINTVYNYAGVYTIAIDDGPAYTEAELRAIIAQAERCALAEAVVQAAIDFLNDANASPIPLGNAVHMYEQKAKV